MTPDPVPADDERNRERATKLRAAMTPELIALVRSLPHPPTEDEVPTLMLIASSLGLFGNDPFPLPLAPARPVEPEETR